jgi:hypothetical protein
MATKFFRDGCGIKFFCDGCGNKIIDMSKRVAMNLAVTNQHASAYVSIDACGSCAPTLFRQLPERLVEELEESRKRREEYERRCKLRYG